MGLILNNFPNGLFTLIKTGAGTTTGPNRKYSTMACGSVHTGPGQRQGLGSIVSYCANPFPCIGPGPAFM